jgi:molybdopterin synthase catalytic subunit
MMKSFFRVVEHDIDSDALLCDVGDPAAGGTTLFVGTTRNENEGRVVERLEYEAYETMAVDEMRRIGDEIARRWQVVAVSMVHRVGVVPVGEASVAVAVSAAHRDEAFAACRFGIDTLKATVPIWKKEYYRGGEHWVGPCHVHAASGRG